jgi:hypothetical protein
MLAARSYHTATLLPNGKVLIAGGDAAEDAEDPGNRQAGSTAPPRIPAELYDPISAKFGAADQIGVMLAGRVGHSATLLRNGDVLITGGCVNGGMTPSTLYSPKTGKFRGVPGPAGCGSTATLLPDGTVLIVGGTDPNEMSGGILDDSAIYDPKNGRLSAAGTIPGGRTGHRAVLLKNGKVLIVGGFEGIGTGGAPADTTVLYDSIIHQYATLTP